MSFVNVTKSDLPKVEHSVQGRQQGKEWRHSFIIWMKRRIQLSCVAGNKLPSIPSRHFS
jgi:hypothetical protein